MARPRVGDLLQNYPFWLMDITPSERFPFVALGGPAYGFSQISHPEISVATQPISQVAEAYDHHAFAGASVGALTLSRGVRFYDSSMYVWITRYIAGEDVPERTLLLMQHMGITLEGLGQNPPPIIVPNYVETIRAPGKTWILHDCVPTRYAAGQGLDATSGAITVSDLTIQPVYIDEVSTDPALAASVVGF